MTASVERINLNITHDNRSTANLKLQTSNFKPAANGQMGLFLCCELFA